MTAAEQADAIDALAKLEASWAAGAPRRPLVAEFAAMVTRVERTLDGSGGGYTARIRYLEVDVDAAHSAYLAGAVERGTVLLALRALELAWFAAAAQARRVAAGGTTP